MSQSPFETLRLKLEDWRVSQHFKRVEVILRHGDVSHLPPVLQKAREHLINRLHMYAARGIFPRNYELPTYAPCFIDRDGHECAVAHLVIASGHPDLAYKIANADTYAYVPQMTFPELDTWAAQTGLSKEELTHIQPSYSSYEVSTLATLLYAAWAAGCAAILINGIQIIRRRNGITVPVIGSVISAGLLLIAILCVINAAIIETAPYPRVFSLIDRESQLDFFIFSGFLSFALALLTGGLGLYRLWNFRRLKQEARL